MREVDVAGARTVSLWAQNKLFIHASVQDDHSLVFSGQDLNAPGVIGPEVGEYEYRLTVEAHDVPRVVAALGGQDGDDVLALLVEHADAVVTRGEHTWLSDLGIEPRLWSRLG